MKQKFGYKNYFKETREICDYLEWEHFESVEKFFEGFYELYKNRNKSRLFIVGVGGSAANASHATNDFRKILGVRAYCATDNVAELTARINDETWEKSLVRWLRVEKPTQDDALLVFSVGGGSATVSQNLVEVVKFSKDLGMKIFSIVGRDGGETKKMSDFCIHIPPFSSQHVFDNNRITPHLEAFQGVLFHMLVTLIMERETNEKIS